MTHSRFFIPGASYHICARGNNRQQIFREHQDYLTYLSQLRHYKKKYHFTIHAYCLMPNHIHILGTPDTSENITKTFQCLHRAYTEHFRKKYDHVGHLWQGRFRSILVGSEKGLADCLAYIEHNPVRAGHGHRSNEIPLQQCLGTIGMG